MESKMAIPRFSKSSDGTITFRDPVASGSSYKAPESDGENGNRTQHHSTRRVTYFIDDSDRESKSCGDRKVL
jgi:hypothetical protein